MTTNGIAVIGGKSIRNIVNEHIGEVFDLMKETLLLHRAGRTANPQSQFLRFPDMPDARIISLPASIRAGSRPTGLKWISSFPRNTRKGLTRASAILALNDPDNGFPYAVMEGSIVSAMRTAISAAVAAESIAAPSYKAAAVGFVGAGLISRHILEVLIARNWSLNPARVFDTEPKTAHRFSRYAESLGIEACPVSTIAAAIADCDLVIFATTALVPHVHDRHLFSHKPTVLHISLRDLGPDIIAASDNFVDDPDHCFSANTSLQLAEAAEGHRDFLAGTVADLIGHTEPIPKGKPCVYSPFGLGVLDVALGRFVFEQAAERGLAVPIPDFFEETSVWHDDHAAS